MSSLVLAANRLWLSMLFAVVFAFGVAARAQEPTTGYIPNECGPETRIATLLQAFDRASDLGDVGGGSATVSVFGSASRQVRMAVVQDGMSGVSALYHSVLQVDGSYAEWGGAGDGLKGRSIPVPNLMASNLAVPDFEDSSGCWPRFLSVAGIRLWFLTDSWIQSNAASLECSAVTGRACGTT